MLMVKLTLNALMEKQDEILLTLTAMLASMTKETGCKSFQIFQSLIDKTMFSSIGEWGTRDDLYQYLRSDNFGVLLGTKSLLSTPMQIQILTVSRSEGRALVDSCRRNTLPLAAFRPRAEDPKIP